MEVVGQANVVWLSSDASLGSGFRSKEHYGDAASRTQAPGSAFSFRNRCSIQAQGKSLAGGQLPKVVTAGPASALGGSSGTVLSTQFPVGWGYSLSAQSCRLSCHSVPNSADFSSVTGEASSPFLGGSSSPLFVPANTNAVAGTPVNAAPGGVLDVTSDVEQPGETIGNLLGVGRSPLFSSLISGRERRESLPFNLDSALQESQETAGRLDDELQEILSKISTLQIQNEAMSKQMKDHHDLLMQTAFSLNSKAQEARIEAVKLKKLAIMQQKEEMQKTEAIRKNVRQLLKQEEVQRLEALAARKWPTIPDAPPGEEDASCEVDDGSAGSEEIASIMNYLKESRAPEEGWNQLEVSKVEQSEQALREGDEKESEEEPSEKVIDVDSMTSLVESMECVITHPGALSCTKTVIKKDDARKTAVVTMETSVRCTGEACLLTGLDGDDYVALAIQTLAETSQDLRHKRIQKSGLEADPVAQERHAGIVNLLAHGRIVGSRPMEPPSRFGHESFVVQLQDKTGEKIDALFKPRAYGDAQGWHRAPVEWVAYELNLMLGMDLVPPVAYRRGRIELSCNKSFNEGSFVYYVRNTKELRRVPATGWGVPVARLLSDTRILDCLLNNSDRHHGHFLFGEHWADRFKLLPVLIDHAAGFRAEAVVNMTDENAFQTGPVRCVSAKTYLRLRFLEKEEVAEKFQGFLKPHEVEQMMKRRDEVLSYLDSLVAERGYQRTVIEM